MGLEDELQSFNLHKTVVVPVPHSVDTSHSIVIHIVLDPLLRIGVSLLDQPIITNFI